MKRMTPQARDVKNLVDQAGQVAMQALVVERALARGRDKVLGSPKPFWKNVVYDVKRGLGCIVKRRDEVGVRLIEVPAVLLIASAWWLLMIVGGLAAMIAPKEMRKRFPSPPPVSMLSRSVLGCVTSVTLR